MRSIEPPVTFHHEHTPVSRKPGTLKSEIDGLTTATSTQLKDLRRLVYVLLVAVLVLTFMVFYHLVSSYVDGLSSPPAGVHTRR